MRALRRFFGASTAVMLASVGFPTHVGAALVARIPSYSLEERAEAIARPALVFFEARSEGFVRSKATGELLSPDPVIVFQRCSGSIVSPQGDVITATHCVQPTANGWRDNAFHTLIDRLMAFNQIPQSQSATQFANYLANAEYTGKAPNSAPDIKILAQQNTLRSGEAVTPATVIAVKPLNEENIALVRLSVSGLPMVEIGGGTNIDDQLVLLAYSAVAATEGERTFAPRSGPARIAALPAVPTGPSKLDADLGVYSHGGMAIDKTGKMVGMINIDRDAKDLPRRALVPPAIIKAFLDSQGVSNGPGPVDVAYRAGLDNYYTGRYSDSIKSFDAVLRLVPDHQLAAQYKKLAVDRRAIEGDPVPPNNLNMYLLGGAIGAAAVLVVVLLLILLTRRRRQKRQLAQQQYTSPYAPPISAAPVSAFPTSGGLYEPTGYEQTGYPFAQQQANSPFSMPSTTIWPYTPVSDSTAMIGTEQGADTSQQSQSDQEAGRGPWAPREKSD